MGERRAEPGVLPTLPDGGHAIRQPEPLAEPAAVDRPSTPIARASSRETGLVHAFEHRLASWLEHRANRVIFGILGGLIALLVKSALNTTTGEETGYIGYYLVLAASAAAGGMASGVATTAIIAVGQAFVFYQPVGQLVIGDSANALRLSLFTITGLLVSAITNGLLRARLRAETVGGEVSRLYDAEAGARRTAEEAGRRTQILFETAAGLSDALTPRDVAAVVIRQGVLALGAVGGAVHTVSADGTALELLRADGYPHDVTEAYRRVPVTAETAIGAVAATGRPVYLANRHEIQQRFPASIERAHVSGEQSFIGLPITLEGRTLGVISLTFGKRQSISAQDRDFHATLAQQVGQSLERARLFEAERVAREAAERAEVQAGQLQAITTALSQSLTVDGVADVVLAQALPAVGATGGGVALLDADGRTIRGIGYNAEPDDPLRPNPTLQIDDVHPAAVALRRDTPVVCETAEEIARAFPALQSAIAAGGTRAFAIVPFAVEEAVRGEIVVAWPEEHRVSAEQRAFLAAIAKEVSQALLRARLHAGEQRARTEAEESRAALAFLAEASRVLATSLDYETTIQRVADLTVPLLADWCAVDLVEPDGSIRAVAVAHADPERRGLLREYRDRYPPREVARGSASVIASGEPMLMPVIDEDVIDQTAPNPEIAAYAKRLEVRSYLAVPIRTPEGILGAFAFSSSTPGRFTGAELAIAEDLARRAGDTIRHARLYRDARQLVATVDAALDAVFMFEPVDLRFTYVNQGALNQVGFSREELLSMSALEIKPDFDEVSYRALIAPLLDGTRPSVTFTTTHLHRAGTRVPVEVFLQAVRLPGDKVRMIVTARDIRQQIEVEANLYRLARAERARAAELSAVIRGMGEGVLVCDPEGRVILSNPAASAILATNVERYEDLVALLEPPAAELPQLASAGGPVEVRLAATDRWLDLSTYPVSLESGELYGEAETTIIVLRDVTAARRARSAREAFIGVMSHELRTPITTIYGTTKLFSRAANSPELMRSMLSDVESEADRLYRLVEDLLILSRSETEIQVEGEPVLLQHVVRSVLSGESARWPETRFTGAVPAGLPPVLGDKTYLEQVVRNLLSNAAKYSPIGANVEVRADIEGTDIAVRVLDNGPGFAGDEAESLFELFYRSPSTSKKAAGAGIGLYVSRALIEAMGGRIWARPRPEGGAEFGFTVPILEAEAEPDDVDEAAISVE